MGDIVGELFSDNLVPATQSPPQPEKRGRGRPRKNPQAPPTRRESKTEEDEHKRKASSEPAPADEKACDKYQARLDTYEKNSTLGPYLQEIKFDFCKARSVTDAKEQAKTLERIDAILASKNSSSVVDSAAKQALYMMEVLISSKTELKLSGFSSACFSDAEWRFLFERVKARWGMTDILPSDPTISLMMTTYQTAMLVHARNEITHAAKKDQEKYAAKLDKPANVRLPEE